MENRSIFDEKTCVRKGYCPISQVRNPLESHSIYYEQHGDGPERIVFIMGLNSSCFNWATQIEHFGPLSQYSALVFDNRGVGYSHAPRGPYTTSGMAEDAIVLLDFLGWTAPRSLHVVGLSLGGMIAQELATRISERIVTLTLGVTTAGGNPWTNLPPWKGASSLARLMTVADPEVKIPIILDMIYPQGWLEKKAENDSSARTNRKIQTEIYRRRIEITKPQTLTGAISQMAAGLTHHVSPARLLSISTSIPRVLIVTGDQDNLVNPSNSLYLKRHMPEAEYVLFEETGHVIHAQNKERFNALLEKAFTEGRKQLEAERHE